MGKRVDKNGRGTVFLKRKSRISKKGNKLDYYEGTIEISNGVLVTLSVYADYVEPITKDGSDLLPVSLSKWSRKGWR